MTPAEHEKLEAELEANARDAARYRWLRENSLSIGGGMWFTVDDQAQEAIDAAMGGKP